MGLYYLDGMGHKQEASVYECARIPQCIELHGYLDYLPSLPANIAFLVIFSLFFFLQLGLGLYHRTYSYMTFVLLGITLECIGYGGRIGMYYNVFTERNFILYLCGLTIGPAFFSAAVYLCIGRIIRIYGSTLTFFKPRTITLGFICCDMVSLVLQAAGGGMASAAKGDDEKARQKGVDVMIAGLSTQVVATSAFCVVCGHLMWSVRKRPERVNAETGEFRRRTVFRAFLWGIGVATVTILIRCIFRVAELSKGFKSKLANDEVQFEVWDSAMMIACVAALSVAHPGQSLGDWWQAGAMQWNTKKTDSDAAEAGETVVGDKSASDRSESVSAPASENGMTATTVVTATEKEGGDAFRVMTSEREV